MKGWGSQMDKKKYMVIGGIVLFFAALIIVLIVIVGANHSEPDTSTSQFESISTDASVTEPYTDSPLPPPATTEKRIEAPLPDERKDGNIAVQEIPNGPGHLPVVEDYTPQLYACAPGTYLNAQKSITLDCPSYGGEITIQIGIDLDGPQDAIYLCPKSYVTGTNQFSHKDGKDCKVGYYVFTEGLNPCMMNTISYGVNYLDYPDMNDFIISRNFDELADSTFYTRDAPGLDWFAMEPTDGDCVHIRAIDLNTHEMLANVCVKIEQKDGYFFVSDLYDARVPESEIPSGLIQQAEIDGRTYCVEYYSHISYADWFDAGYTYMVEKCESRAYFDRQCKFTDHNRFEAAQITEFPVYAVTLNTAGSTWLGPLTFYYRVHDDGSIEYIATDFLRPLSADKLLSR